MIHTNNNKVFGHLQTKLFLTKQIRRLLVYYLTSNDLYRSVKQLKGFCKFSHWKQFLGWIAVK